MEQTEQPDWFSMLEKMQDIRQFCSNHVKRVIKGGMTSAQELDVLSRLAMAQERQTPLQLCSEMGVSKSMVSRLIEQLEQKGLIEKQVSKQDKRSYELVITPLGSRELEKTYSYYLRPVYQLRRVMGLEEFGQLMSLIRRSNELVPKQED